MTENYSDIVLDYTAFQDLKGSLNKSIFHRKIK